MKTISNKQLTIQVSPHGAELCSIVANGKEYLWQADPAFWKRHSPVLFPIVGSVWENEYRNEGIPYTLTQHGFARDMEFTLISEKEDEVRYRLVSNEETLHKYPFPFCLEIGYRIQGKKIEVMWEVKNTGDKEMYFQIGAHPAFYWPEFDASNSERGFFRFDKENGLKYILISEKGCADPSTEYSLELTDGLLPLDTHTFDKDALILENEQVRKVTLYNKEKQAEICANCTKGTIGCGECKKMLTDKINAFLDPIREKRAYYENNPQILDEIIDDGNRAARKVACETMEMVREAMKI